MDVLHFGKQTAPYRDTAKQVMVLPQLFFTICIETASFGAPSKSKKLFKLTDQLKKLLK
ncbi:MAG: hypothetical protein PUC57_07970 [Oscillospiraceae bacterium]|nr:hypothetical protein [Oscillospiraceae bacterium]